MSLFFHLRILIEEILNKISQLLPGVYSKVDQYVEWVQLLLEVQDF